MSRRVNNVTTLFGHQQRSFWSSMKVIHLAIILTSLSTVANSQCADFEKEWKVCSDDMYPGDPINNSHCEYNSHTFTKLILVRDVCKRSLVYCQDEKFPDAIFDCRPLQDSCRFILTDCPFRQNLFDKFFQNSSLDELLVRNKNSDTLYSSIHLRHLPRFRFLSLINIRTPPYFDLSMFSIPYMTSIMISNFTFSSLPPKPFEDLPKLRGLSLTKGMLETLPSGFLDLSDDANLTKLDLSSNKLKNFQPRLLRNMKTLKSLNLAHNFIDTLDGILFVDTRALEEVLLSYNRIKSLPSRLFRTTPAIKILLLDHNALSEIPGDIFQGLHRLLSLKLSHNRLSFLPPNLLNDATSLAILQLQSNQLRTVPTDALPPPSALQVIDLSDNNISEFISSAPFGNSNKLTKINMSSNHLSEFTNVRWHLYKFKQLDLSNNLIPKLTIPISWRSGRGEIFLRSNKIRSVTVINSTAFDYKYFLSGNPFDCSCNLNTTFISSVEAVRDVDNLTCVEPWFLAGRRIADFDKEDQLCGIRDDCPPRCKCSLSDDRVQVDCRSAMIATSTVRLPHNTAILYLQNNQIASLMNLTDETWDGLTHLYLSNNDLTSLQGWSVPAGLRLLALDGNKLNGLPSSVTDMVDQSENFSISLRENDWPCDCESTFGNWFIKNVDKVVDAKETYCNLHGSAHQALLAELGCSSPRIQRNSCSNMYTSISVILCCLLVFFK